MKPIVLKARLSMLLAMLLACVLTFAGAESLFPSSDSLFGVTSTPEPAPETTPETAGNPMPSLGDVLHRYPESTVQLAGGEQEQHWSGVTAADFEAFGVYLSAAGASLRDYTVENGVFSAAVEKDRHSFTFVYDSVKLSAVLTYPADVYDERLAEAEELYNTAMAQVAQGNYAQALETFRSIRDCETYRDVKAMIEVSSYVVSTSAAHHAKLAQYTTIGSYVVFGTYPQTSRGTDSTPVEWLILDYDAAANRALLISRYGLDSQPYNTENAEVTWEQCTLRTWLNNDFYQRAFIDAEKEAILTTMVDNSSAQQYSGWNTDGGSNTQDKVFLLSITEAIRYFGLLNPQQTDNENNMKARLSPTDYAIRQRAYTNKGTRTVEGKPSGIWWLRSPGSQQDFAASIRSSGNIGMDNVYRVAESIRPAIWINLNSSFFGD